MRAGGGSCTLRRKSLLLTDDTGCGKSLSSLCSPVYLVQNITFFKHIFTEFAQIENGYKLQPGLARTSLPPPTKAGGLIALYLHKL